MTTQELLNECMKDAKGYTFGKIKITPKLVPGAKVGYACDIVPCNFMICYMALLSN